MNLLGLLRLFLHQSGRPAQRQNVGELYALATIPRSMASAPEVHPTGYLTLVRNVVHQLGSSAESPTAIAIDVMSPSWIAMDNKAGRLPRS